MDFDCLISHQIFQVNTDQDLNLTKERSYERLRDTVIGAGDGLTIPFALAAGLSNVVESNQVIVTAGIIALAAGGHPGCDSRS